MLANIANGFLSINLDKASELNKSGVEEIINKLEIIIISYCGDCEGTFNEEDKVIDLTFAADGLAIHVGMD